MPGRPWTRDDDQRLKQELLAGVPIDEVSRNLERTIAAIQARVVVLRISLNGRSNQRPTERRMDHLLKRPVNTGLKAKK